jgi:hypothetical protein
MGIADDMTSLRQDVNEASAQRKKAGTARREENRRLREETEELRADTRDMISDFSIARRKNAAELKKELRAGRTELSDYIRSYIEACKDEIGGYNEERLAMHMAWRENDVPVSKSRIPSFKPEKEVPRPVVAEIPETTVRHESEEEAAARREAEEYLNLKNRTLKVINASPYGISLKEIGDKFNMEWRKLIRPAKDLLEDDLIRKVDINYFPRKGAA